MHFASEFLRKEHYSILFGLRILEQMVSQLRTHSPPEIQELKDMVGFLKTFADRCHHGKEEGLFYPALEKAGVPNQGGPIGQMLLEHTQGRAFIARMSAALDSPYRPTEVAVAANGYIDLLRAHIEKENDVLFHMGDARIPVEEQERLVDAFETFEEEVMGGGVRERLHAMLDKYEAKYLE
jgi:hemerythrin-like domain-containing protein